MDNFEVLLVTSPQHADQRLQWQWEAIHPRCTRPLPIWQKHRLEKALGGHLVQIPWASRASCLGPGTSNFWVCPKREIPQHLWETCASTLCSMCEHRWMVHLGCCKLVLSSSTLGCRGPASVISNGNCHCGADNKREVLSFTLGDFVTTETEALFHKTFKFYSSEIVHPNILRKMLTDSLLKSCIYCDCHWCKHCHKKAAHQCKPQAVEKLLQVL